MFGAKLQSGINRGCQIITDGFVQYCGNSIADALELPQPGIKPLTQTYIHMYVYIFHLLLSYVFWLSSVHFEPFEKNNVKKIQYI